MTIGRKHIFSVVAISVLLAIVVSIFAGASLVYAEDVSSAQSSVDDAKAQLASVQAEYDEANATAQSLRSEIEEATTKAFAAQDELLKEQESLNNILYTEYKNGSSMPIIEMLLGSTSFDSFVKNLDYANRIMHQKAEAIQSQKKAKDEFNSVLAELNAKQDEYEQTMATANEKLNQAQSIYENAKAQLSQAEAESMKPTPTPEPTPEPSGDMKSGIASAYNDGTTATGEPVTESSMGVSIPMSMPGYRSLFGHTVQITIGGTTVLARVNDCGGLDGGARCMDVQPGVYHAFGYNSASAWGLRQVSYRFM